MSKVLRVREGAKYALGSPGDRMHLPNCRKYKEQNTIMKECSICPTDKPQKVTQTEMYLLDMQVLKNHG